jgi:hypothetical protein
VFSPHRNLQPTDARQLATVLLAIRGTKNALVRGGPTTAGLAPQFARFVRRIDLSVATHAGRTSSLLARGVAYRATLETIVASLRDGIAVVAFLKGGIDPAVSANRNGAGTVLALVVAHDTGYLPIFAGLRDGVAVVTFLEGRIDPTVSANRDGAGDFLALVVADDTAFLPMLAGLRDDVSVVTFLDRLDDPITAHRGFRIRLGFGFGFGFGFAASDRQEAGCDRRQGREASARCLVPTHGQLPP